MLKVDMKNSYWRFGAMIITSMIVMFGLMYLNTYAWEHVRWSETRFYMAFIMGAAMAVVMLSFMLNMYKDSRINFGIFIGAAVVFVLALWLVRSQSTVDDRSYMKAMIPHHSIAIMTSERAGIEDVRVRELADEIITAQRREIKEMEWLISDQSLPSEYIRMGRSEKEHVQMSRKSVIEKIQGVINNNTSIFRNYEISYRKFIQKDDPTDFRRFLKKASQFYWKIGACNGVLAQCAVTWQRYHERCGGNRLDYEILQRLFKICEAILRARGKDTYSSALE